jgi:GDP-D-mannose dehydratase
LTSAYWECGNSRPFLEIVKELTGRELSGESWVSVLKESVDDKIKREKKEYDAAIAESGKQDICADVDLDMVVRFVDGDTLISDSSKAKGGLLGACKDFENFVAARVAASSP